jgi:acyl carrier protein
MLISSLASILGGLGFCAYSAANAFMDAFAQQQSRKGASPWVSINWESWVNRAKNVSLAGGGATASFSLTPAEGIIAFERALALKGEPQIVMSSGDLQARIDEWARAVPGENSSRDSEELVSPAHSRPNLRNAYVAPASDVEEGIAGIWRELLGIDRIGAHDSFFELNGNSLLATRIISRVRAAFRVNVPLRAIFESPTIAALAKAVIEERGESQLTMVDGGAADSRGEPGARRTIPRRDRVDSLPLSFAQQRLWFLDRLEPGNPVYNLPVAVRLSGPIDVAALERSLAEVVRRHEALRTSFPLVDGRPAQVICPNGEIANLGFGTLPVIDLSSLPEADREAEARRLCEVEAQRPFDLAAGPVFRILLLRLGEQQHILAATMHHIVSDGWSMEIFVSEVTLLYQAFASGRPSPLAELPIQFADFALWQRETLTDEVLEHQLTYWRQQLGEYVPELKLPTDRARPATQTFRGARHILTLQTDFAESLKEYSRSEGATLFMTLLATFDALLRHHTRQDDIVVGTHVAGRNSSEMEGLIGFFVNTLVLRADLSGDPSFRELLARVREVALDAYAHQDVPFDRLVSELQPKRDASRNPLFQVLFILLNAPPQTVEQPGLKLTVLDVFTNTAVVDCSVVITDAPDGLRIIFRYNADLFDASTISRLARHYETALGAFQRNPELSLDGLSALLDESDRKEQLSKEKGLKEARLRKFGKLKRMHQSSA